MLCRKPFGLGVGVGIALTGGRTAAGGWYLTVGWTKVLAPFTSGDTRGTVGRGVWFCTAGPVLVADPNTVVEATLFTGL